MVEIKFILKLYYVYISITFNSLFANGISVIMSWVLNVMLLISDAGK